MVVCKEYESRIGALMDDELTAEERIAVLEHLAQCPACRAYWEDLLSVREALCTQTERAPVGFAEAVMARVHETKQDVVSEQKVLRFPQWKRFAALAACCAVVLLGIWAIPGVDNNSMDKAMTNGSAAPERARQESSTTGSPTELPDVDYDVSQDGGFAVWQSEMPDALPESNGEADDAKDCAEASACDFVAAIRTASVVAERWVQSYLGQEWRSGERYVLSEAQYYQLYELLKSADEAFTEIQGNTASTDYQLLAE